MQRNPLDTPVVGQCAGCLGEIYEGDDYRIISVLPGTRKMVHNYSECFCLVLDAKAPEEEAEHPRPVKHVSLSNYFKPDDPEINVILHDCLPDLRD